uniref:Leukemia NUP98 fusion partner 1 n=1 Tax=Bos taurus TaxID=9913 RepID=A0ABI0NP41_BOVIN
MPHTGTCVTAQETGAGSPGHELRVWGIPCLTRGPASQHRRQMDKFPVLPRMMSSASHPRRYSYEDQGFRCHTQVRDHRKCSGDGSFKEPLESKGRSHSKIQSFSDSFEQQLCFRTKRSVSLGPESRKERNERERRFLEVRSCKKVEEKRSSRKEEHGEAYLPTLSEKALK